MGLIGGGEHWDYLRFLFGENDEVTFCFCLGQDDRQTLAESARNQGCLQYCIVYICRLDSRKIRHRFSLEQG